MDKVSAGLKNADSKLGQEVDESRYNSKIRSLEKDISDLKAKLGEKVYEAFEKNEEFDTKPCCEKIKSIYEEIAAVEAEKEEMIASAKAEREKNRKEASDKKE